MILWLTHFLFLDWILLFTYILSIYTDNFCISAYLPKHVCSNSLIYVDTKWKVKSLKKRRKKDDNSFFLLGSFQLAHLFASVWLDIFRAIQDNIDVFNAHTNLYTYTVYLYLWSKMREWEKERRAKCSIILFLIWVDYTKMYSWVHMS